MTEPNEKKTIADSDRYKLYSAFKAVAKAREGRMPREVRVEDFERVRAMLEKWTETTWTTERYDAALAGVRAKYGSVLSGE